MRHRAEAHDRQARRRRKQLVRSEAARRAYAADPQDVPGGRPSRFETAPRRHRSHLRSETHSRRLARVDEAGSEDAGDDEGAEEGGEATRASGLAQEAGGRCFAKTGSIASEDGSEALRVIARRNAKLDAPHAVAAPGHAASES